MISIRRRLLGVLFTAVVLAMFAGAAGTYRLALRGIDQVFDYHLEQLALSLRDQAFASTYNPPLPPSADDEFDFVIQVWTRDGDRLYFSNPQVLLPNRAQLGFATLETAEGKWRVFTIALRDQVIQVAQPLSARQKLATSAALHTVLPFIFLLPLLGGLIWWLVGRELAPLYRIAHSVGKRTPNSLEPLRLDGVPSEAQPLVESINHLLERLAAALASQRAFVADAAHELRTPLTALQLQMQLTERAETAEDRNAAIAELKHGLQRASRVVQQLLTLARQDPAEAGVTAGSSPVVRLAELAALAAADHAALAEAKHIDLGVSASDESAVVRGNFEDLRTLAANLIGNAVRYTPDGGRVDVAVRSGDGRCWIEVDDSGPGIPPEERERVFDRFYRRADNGEPGSGLGLAIVKAIATRHGASVSLDTSALGGLAARVSFPAASDATTRRA
ncbi:MAG: sensor histidine kinase N-terminal domain-containing protein [Betaproteobacteria bacterium]|nr:sensor histidine kinase N-terminal domain-containing protein [Betaproteobacteria bacterium]